MHNIFLSWPVVNSVFPSPLFCHVVEQVYNRNYDSGQPMSYYYTRSASLSFVQCFLHYLQNQIINNYLYKLRLVLSVLAAKLKLHNY